MYGYKKSYEGLLKESGFDRLADTREAAVRKFALKTQKNPVYSHWFPYNPNQTSVRKPTVYREEFARTQRLYNSPLFYMRRLLNDTEHKEEEVYNYLDLAYLFDEV